MKQEIRLLVADDHPIVREGLRFLINSEPGMQLVGEAHDGESAVYLYRKLQPDVLLIDLKMPGKDGLTAIREVKELDPLARIIVLTSYIEEIQVIPAIKSGARGYLLKNTNPQVLLQAIREIYRGDSFLDPIAARIIIDELNGPMDSAYSLDSLSKRETEVLQLIGKGLSNQDIANKLFISERTARNHVGNILAKLRLSNRTQVALYANRQNF